MSRDGFTCPHCGVTGAANWKQIVDEYNAGVGMRTLAERHGIDIAAVCRGLHKRGVSVRPAYYSGPFAYLTRDWGAIAEEYRAGASLESLGRKHGMTTGTVLNWFKRLGIPRREPGKHARPKTLRPPKERSAKRGGRRTLALAWDAIAVEYENGATLSDLTQRFGASLSTLSRGLRRRGVRMRSGTHAHRRLSPSSP
jgi:transposase-like protein